MTKNEFKALFLKLTQYTIPFGKEKFVEKYLPQGFKKDSVGNYYYEIGQSETLFTTHLDTYSKDFKKVNQLQDIDDEYIISTDENTILGGDNKLGCCILIGMIKNKIPGTYFFFLGEEPILSGGLWGSSNALANNPEYFSKFKRCIAFDRRGYGSVVIRQMGRMSSSKTFITSIANKLKEFGNIEFDESSQYGYYTDTATFMDVIPECTNISVGGFGEHTVKEWVDLNYTYNVYQTALKIKWDELPVERQIGEPRFHLEPENIVKKFKLFKQKNILPKLKKSLEKLDLVQTREIKNGDTIHLTYSMWLQDKDFDIWINDNKIYLDSELKSPVEVSSLISDLKARMIK